jgi:2',3'-cyclic-nucleotide 2'-phosphodiesterase
MKILFIGDISARHGRHAVTQMLSEIKEEYGTDLVIANCENAAGGVGITTDKLRELQDAGVDFFTAGEHVWRIGEFVDDLRKKNLPIVRAYNYEGGEEIPGNGYNVVEVEGKGRVLVAAFMGATFMAHASARNPFWAADDFLKEIEHLKYDYSIIDFHAEATAEKETFALYLDGKIDAIVGTHTHVATADQRILPKGTAFVTDVGMAGVRNASLWVEAEIAIKNSKFPFRIPFEADESKDVMINSVLIEFDNKNGNKIERVDKFFKLK